MTQHNVEDIHRLSPLQAGMLFHSVDDSGGEQPYLVQTVDELSGPLDRSAFRQTWQQLLDRHTALRSVFLWEDLPEPLQVVQRRVELPLAELDWRAHPDTEQRARLDGLLRENRAAGLDLTAAPLFRLTLVAVAPGRHWLLWTFHHLLLDGWSLPLLQREFAELYRAALSSVPARLPAPVPYSRYIAWLDAQPKAAAREFWQSYLAGFAEPTRLGVDGPTGRTGFAAHELVLDRARCARVREFAQRSRVTVNVLVQAAWALLLSRYGNGEDVLFGTTVAGRPPTLAGAESMVGMFINTLPVRLRVPGGERVSAWLRQVQRQQAEYRQYEFGALSEIHGWSGLPKGSPLFRSILVFENYPAAPEPGRPDELTAETLLSVENTGYPLTLVAYAGRELGVRFSYDRSVFDRAAVERMAGHFENLLDALVAAPDARLDDLDLLGPEERHRLLRDGNDTAAPRPPERTVHQLVEEQARARPDAVALVHGDRRLRYRELNERANRLAHRLRGLGARPDTTVGVCAERGPELVVALLAVLKSGAAYLPLDPAHPTDRLTHLLLSTGTAVVLHDAHLADRLGPYDGTLLALDDPATADHPGTDPDPVTRPDHLAYVIHTSGSTGTPKGVQITHRNVLGLFAATAPEFGFGPQDAWTFFHSFAFDFSVWELWCPLTTGGRVVVVDRATATSPAELLDLLARQEVTVLNQTPSAFAMLQQALDPASAARLRLRLVVFGGEALRPARLGRWHALMGERPVRLANMYGITEVTVHATLRDVRPADILATDPGSPVGRPLGNTRAYVLDPAGRPVPIGVPGELYIGGEGLARGYLGRPALTAERFVPDPFTPGARLYRTGDLARRRADGDLEYLGRGDDQVKIRGHRIEPGEIDARLQQHPAVTASTTVVREDDPGDRQLVSYLTTEAGTAPTTTELREHLRALLPAHMLPAAFVTLDRLPLTPNGKTDRRALPAPGRARPELAADYTAPRTAVEESVAAVWAEVLGLAAVGVHDDFFDLGGDSVKSLRIAGRLRRLDLAVGPGDILRNPTVARTAAAARAAAAGGRTERGADGPEVSVTWLSRGPDGAPVLFCFPEISNTVHGYARLAAALGPEVSVVALAAGRLRAGEGLPELARAFWRAVRDVRPTGPYLLAGWSMGGVVAAEVARLIEESGERAALLTLFDSCLPTPEYREHLAGRAEIARELDEKLRAAGPGFPDTPWTAEVEALLPELDLPVELLTLAREDLLAHLATLRHNLAALIAHRPRPVRCPALLFQAAESDWPVPPAEGWAAFVGSLTVRPARGGHLTLLQEPYVAGLAAELGAALRDHRPTTG
ncbi:amino acid adenylation domain-containing protein [Kitasatospora sp. NPDC059827]|uniref:amino acid adenylation domain-containing protein n=1 Tax=Kitasatospora sp. NPDC059827 TaxID=3346964 RepID=UPI0036678234